MNAFAKSFAEFFADHDVICEDEPNDVIDFIDHDLDDARYAETDDEAPAFDNPLSTTLGAAIASKAITFLGRYDATFKQIDGYEPDQAASAILLAAAEGRLVDGDPQAGYSAALRLVSQLMRQCSQTVFFELDRRNFRAQKAAQSATMPQADVGSHSEAMLELLARLNVRPATENLEDKVDCDADPIESASNDALKDALVSIHDYLMPIHSQLFACRYGRTIDRPLGLTSIKLPDGSYVEVESFDTALALFQQEREDKLHNRQVTQQKLAKGILSALIRA